MDLPAAYAPPEASTSLAPLPDDAVDEQPQQLRPVLQNLVATCKVADDLDLKAIATGARNAEYNPKRFAAVIIRIREPKTTALIFKSGKMVVTGAKSEEAARQAARKYARLLQKLNCANVVFQEFKIQNMVRAARRERERARRSALHRSSPPFSTISTILPPSKLTHTLFCLCVRACAAAA